MGYFDLGEKAYKPHLTKIKAAGVDTILTWILDFVVAKIAIEKKALGMNDVHMIGSSADRLYLLQGDGLELVLSLHDPG